MTGLFKETLLKKLPLSPDIQHKHAIAATTITLATTTTYKSGTNPNHSFCIWDKEIMWLSWAQSAGNYLKKGHVIRQEGTTPRITKIMEDNQLC